MQRITRDQARKYAFDWRDEPLLRVQPGEAFEIETCDASTGYFKTGGRQGHPRSAARLRPQPTAGEPHRRPGLGEGASAATPWRSPLRRSWWRTTPGSPSVHAAAHWANPLGGRNCRATTRPGSSVTPPAPAAPRGRHACTSTIGSPGRSPRSSGRWASRRTARSPRAGTGRASGAGTWTSGTWRRATASLLPIFHRRRPVLPGRRPRQPGRHRVHRHGRGDDGDGAGEAGGGKGKDDSLDADREAGRTGGDLRLPAPGGGGGNRHVRR